MHTELNFATFFLWCKAFVHHSHIMSVNILSFDFRISRAFKKLKHFRLIEPHQNFAINFHDYITYDPLQTSLMYMQDESLDSGCKNSKIHFFALYFVSFISQMLYLSSRMLDQPTLLIISSYNLVGMIKHILMKTLKHAPNI